MKLFVISIFATVIFIESFVNQFSMDTLLCINRIEKQANNNNDNKTSTFLFSLQKWNTISEDEGKEFSYHNSKFDVVSITINKGIVKVICINDNIENAISKIVQSLTNTGKRKHTGSINNTIHFEKYFQNTGFQFAQIHFKILKNYWSYTCCFHKVLIKIFVPPPQIL